MLAYVKFILILFFPIIYSKSQSKSELYSHNILEQYSYYKKSKKFNNSFIDFINYKVYKISKNEIMHKNQEDNNFFLKWEIQKNNNFLIECINETCSDIDLIEHDVISFDFDRVLSTHGSIFAYILIVYGFFNLKRGYTYLNLTALFYGSLSFVLFIREFCQILELTGNLATLHKSSNKLVYIVFYSTWFISILFGFVCHFANSLKYFIFGFIEGMIFGKLIFYLLVLIKIIKNDLLKYYLIIVILTTLANIAIIGFFKNKYPKFCILNISIIGGYGIIFGINIINGGLPFLPYLILTAKYDEDELFKRILDKNLSGYYSFLYLIFIFCGIFWNNSRFNKLKNKNMKLK